jgi:hypothetical protein
VLGELEAVGADIAHAPGGAGARRIGPPRGLFLPARFERLGRLEPLGEPALRILDHHPADRAETTRRHQVSGLLHHGVAGVVVGEAEQAATRGDRIPQLERLRQIERHRLVAGDVEAVLERRHRDRMVEMVGGDDRHQVDALRGRATGLALEHLAPGPVAALVVEQEVAAGGFRGRWISAERAADQLDEPIQTRRRAVHRADERSTPTADHAHADASLHRKGRW